MNQHLCHHNEVSIFQTFIILLPSVFTDVFFTQLLFENLKFYSLHHVCMTEYLCHVYANKLA